MVYLGRIVLVIVFLFRDNGGGMMDRPDEKGLRC
jgi:hypothetical protein